MSGGSVEEDSLPEEVASSDHEHNEKKLSRRALRRYDSLDIESRKVSGHQFRGSKVVSWSIILQLAFQSMGVVYGGLGTSPLYVLSGTFPNGVKYLDDILGVLSLIFYTITLIPLINYVFIVLRANDNGDGGTFALYSLICRHAKVGLIPSEQAEDCDVSNYRIELPSDSRGARRALKLKSVLENSHFANFSISLSIGDSSIISS